MKNNLQCYLIYNTDTYHFKLPRTLSEIKKKEMVAAFKKGVNLDELSILYKLKVITIKKHLKNSLGETEFKKTINLNQIKEVNFQDLDGSEEEKSSKAQNDENFFEIPPLNETYDFGVRKDFASKPLKDFELPENIFLIVNTSIDLEIFSIRDFPEYSFLSETDQNRKIIKLFSDKKSANSFCNKNQKIIKVPNGNIFLLASSFLREKGITRIIYDDNLLSL